MGVFFTSTTSPIWNVLNSHCASAGFMLRQPCETLRTPWSGMFQSAEWQYSPEYEIRTQSEMSSA